MDFGLKENEFLYEYTTQFEELQLELVTQIKEADKIKSDLNVASNKIETIKTYDKNCKKLVQIKKDTEREI